MLAISLVRGRPARAVIADYLSLMKPGVLSLLVVTELLAMVTAARGWPGWGLTLIALAAGCLAAGGAAAINCWFDRDIDAVMGRTRSRPVPAGRIQPAAALVFGTVLATAGVVVFFVFVNPLAAGLALFGGVFYVCVYTFWLKRATAQNIVIGGAAGAMPPLVGWAAVTHSLSPVAIGLFVVIFLWTPPHFWALSLIVRRDYAAVSVPMRSVALGVKRTRRGIVAYAILLLAASCSLGIWLGAGEVVLALLTGVPLLAMGLVVMREGASMRWARRLFQFSILYLFLFFAGTAAVAVLR